MHLDFIRPRRRPAASAWLLLLLGLVAAGSLAAWRVLTVEPDLRAAEAELRSLQAGLATRQPSSARLNDEQLASDWARAAKIAEDLAAPWAELFGVLESAAGQPVALLSVEPDGARRELVLNGEARDYAALLDYYRFLQQQPLLSGVALHTHQVNQQDRDKPVRFRITARWERAS
jgi:Tfp pilus assembly protein PilN